ncbi:MAG TPA: pseudouridine synthase [Actinomycetes bacterium]|nr:pseudouridine synthase [Actinomycetes bacterium]
MNDQPDHPSPERLQPERLQKVLARAGVASRRACEALIAEGRVEVDGVVVSKLGTRVDPSTAVIRVDGVRVSVSSHQVYLMLNKPAGVVSTMADPEGRPCLGDYVGSNRERLFHVGRLDVDTEGLLLLTNDGTLAHRLAHPSFEIPKTYLADVPAPLPRDLGRRLREGIDLEDGPVRFDSFRVVGSTASRALVEVTLHEGRNRVVRRSFEAVGFPVTRLVRTAIGPVQLGELRPGKLRPLSSKELGALFELAGL